MERNANENFGSQNSGEATSSGVGSGLGSQSGTTSGFGAGSTSGGTSGGTGTSDASFSRSEESGGLADRAKDIASSAGDRLAGVGSQVRDKAGSLKNSLANVLETGAEKLRAQAAGGGQVAGAAATGGSTEMVTSGDKLATATNQLAGGLQASADWLREADLDSVKSGVERQVKEHPGRSLAIAVGVGYLLGKALRK